jgi:zinc protease
MLRVAKTLATLALFAPFLPWPVAAGDLSAARVFRLDNGLTAATLHDPSHPVVAVQMLYTVGARNETPGITGIAHFLEHMLFRGTRSFGLADVTGVIERAGGEWHGYTYLDCTTYFEAAPRDLLPTLLRLEAERMTAGRIAAAEVDPERGAVFQEYRGYQLDARSDLYDEAIAALFLQHPYRNNTMGWESDLKSIDHGDLVSFYRRYYGPRNAFLAIAGDFDPALIESQVREAFWAFPAGGESTAIRTIEPDLTGQRRVAIRRPGASPALMISFLAPPPSRPRDYATLMVLDAILGSAKGLSFYRHSGELTEGAKVETGSRLGALQPAAAARFGTGLVPTLYPYHYSIYATPGEGRPVRYVEPLVFGALEGVVATVAPAEIDSARRRIEAADLLETDSPVETAHELAFWTSLGGLDLRRTILEALSGVSPEDVQRLARSMSPDRAVVGIALPAGQEEGASREAERADPPATRSPARRASPADRPGTATHQDLPRAGRASVETLPLGAGGRAIVDTRPDLRTFVLRVALRPVEADAADPAGISRMRGIARALDGDAAARIGLEDLGLRSEVLAPGEGSFADRDTAQVVVRGPAPVLGRALRILSPALREAARGGEAAADKPSRDPGERAMQMLAEALPVPGRSAAPPASAAAGWPGAAPGPTLSVALISPFASGPVKGLLRGLAAAVHEGSASSAGALTGANRARRRSGGRPAGGAASPFPAGRLVAAIPAISQGRLLLAFPGDGDPEALRALAYILHHAYGGRLGAKAIAGMGLVYSMDSEAVTRGRPLFYATMGASPESLESLERALGEVLDGTASTLTEGEVAEYRTFAAGDLVVRLADPEKAAALWCATLLRGEDHRGPAASIERARALTLSEVARVARAALDPARRLAVLVTREATGAQGAAARVPRGDGKRPSGPLRAGEGVDRLAPGPEPSRATSVGRARQVEVAVPGGRIRPSVVVARRRQASRETGCRSPQAGGAQVGEVARGDAVEDRPHPDAGGLIVPRDRGRTGAGHRQVRDLDRRGERRRVAVGAVVPVQVAVEIAIGPQPGPRPKRPAQEGHGGSGALPQRHRGDLSLAGHVGGPQPPGHDPAVEVPGAEAAAAPCRGDQLAVAAGAGEVAQRDQGGPERLFVGGPGRSPGGDGDLSADRRLRPGREVKQQYGDVPDLLGVVRGAQVEDVRREEGPQIGDGAVVDEAEAGLRIGIRPAGRPEGGPELLVHVAQVRDLQVTVGRTVGRAVEQGRGVG